MTEVARKWKGPDSEGLNFYCPGCEAIHMVTTHPGGWTWNGDLVKPTLQPSVLVRSGHYAGGVAAERGHCYCNYEERTGHKPHFKCFQCHSFVADGRIQFLSDCTHSLAGQTVELPPWPYGGEEGAS